MPEDVVLELRPDLGVPPLLFGMTTAEAAVAMSGWDEPRATASLPSRPRLNVHDDSWTLHVHANFEAGVGSGWHIG